MIKRKAENITVGELKMHLAAYPDDAELYFNGLEFYRLKDRGPYVQVEFSQIVDVDKEGHVSVMTQLQ